MFVQLADRRLYSAKGRSRGGRAWVGLGLDGKGTWVSTEPCIIAENGLEFHKKLLERFDGKMSKKLKETRNGFN